MKSLQSYRAVSAVFDLVAMNVAFAVAVTIFRAWPGFYLQEPADFHALALCWNVATLVMTYSLAPRRRSVLLSAIALMLLFCVVVALGKFAMPGRRRLLSLFALGLAGLALARALTAHFLRGWMRRDRAGQRILFAGDSPALNRLLMETNATGWKDFAEIRHEKDLVIALELLKSGGYSGLYCSLSRETLADARRLFDYCENNLVRFYGVPEATEYFDRNLTSIEVGDVTVMTPREEPLRRFSNRVLKRALDIVISLGFLCTLFVPILLLVAYKIKKESPGPVFFRQRRHGLDGKEFLCWKFRSMHVNDQSDTAQTAIDDPRKFPFGDKMRRTNIDELPQFINVLLGDMSLVGPRPHPCKMTDDYGEIVNRYRVRLYAKPGVTGWAQVNGARGATLKVEDMIKRVRLDIWYLEHWSFALDLRILAMTFYQTVAGKNKNAF